MATQIDKSPVYLDLDQRRRIEFNLNAANMIRKHTAPGASPWEKIGEVEVKGEVRPQYDINGEALQVYLWACLNVGERLDGTPFNLSIEQVGDLINGKPENRARGITPVNRSLSLRSREGDLRDIIGETTKAARDYELRRNTTGRESANSVADGIARRPGLLLLCTG